MEKRKHSSNEDTPKAKKVKVSSSQSSQSPRKNSNSITGGDADHGVIERIFLKNFMCHGKLDFQFGPNVNFVVGQNGSGKSAVMTALVVGLGGKAAVTNRGTSVKSFIKDGQNTAEICITLRNRGIDAYKPEIYGESIKVERKISKDGSTTYKLRSHKGKVVSNKKEELQMILDQFNIQVDNPVSILNQDTSRNFLFSKDPRSKYKFFMKATQLEQIECEYSRIKELESIIKDNIASKEEGLPELEQEALKKEQKFKDIESLNTLCSKREGLYHLLAWAQVAEQERELQSIKNEVQKEENRLPKFDNKVTDSQIKVQAAEEKHKEVQSNVGEITTKLQELEPQILAKRQALDGAKSRMKDLQKLARNMARTLDSLKKDRTGLEQRIEELRKSAQQDYDQERLQREAQIEKLQQLKVASDARLATTLQDYERFAEATDSSRKTIYELRAKVNDVKHNIDQVTRHVRQLESSKSNSLRLYGEHIPALLSEIEKNAKRFDRKPKGPLGQYLSLRDAHNKWALSVEVVLKGLIFSFCCHSIHDSKLLRQLMKKTIRGNARTPGIIISPFEDQKYDINKGRIHGSIYPSFLDIVEVQDPVIFNCLVDQRGVESILLVEKNEDARRYVLQPPKNCREAFTLSGDQVYAGQEQRYYSALQKHVRVMKADVEDQIRQSKEELATLLKQQEEGNISLREMNSNLSSNERHKQKFEQQRRKLQNEIGHLQAEINELEAIEDPAPMDVSTLEDEVNQLNESIERHKEWYEQKNTELKAAVTDSEEKKVSYAAINEKLQQQTDNAEPLRYEMNKVESEIERAKHERRHYETKRNEQRKKVDGLRKEYDKKSKRVDTDTEKVQEIFPERKDSRRSAKNIENEIQQIGIRIEKEQEVRGDPDEVLNEYQAAKKKFEDAHKAIKKFKNTIKKLQEMLEFRQRAFVQLRHFIALRTKHYFTLMLSQRKYSGKIKFVHKDETLLLEVHPTAGADSNSKSTDMKALSGGERSFSTVCFIMALWESMEAPFRALDEFDVFMDMVNRRIIMDLLMQVAKDHRSRQFIFMTPQDMSRIRASSLVRIVRMQGPRERNQTTLEFPVQDRNEEDEDNT